MKFFSLILIGVGAQRKKDDFGSPIPEKPKNKYNNALGEAAEAYGDPHFMVSSIGSEPICFDYNPEPGSTIMLLTDPESNLVVTGTISNEKVDNKTFIDEILFMSPNGAQLTFNTDGVQLRGLSVRDHIQQEEQETIQYNDIQFVEKWNDDGSRDRIIISITNGPKFLVKAKVKKSSMSFGISDISGLSNRCKGILGNFIQSGSYHILPREELTADGRPQALIINDNMVVAAVKRDFHKSHECWTVDPSQVDELLMNV